MKLLAIDPGTTQSGWVNYCGGRIYGSGVMDNDLLLHHIATPDWADTLAIERFEARGMAIGDESVVTVLWTGRFWQAWADQSSVLLVKRSEVKSYLCGTTRAKDTNVRTALIDLLGEKGTKAAPGPLYGMSSHAWSALAVAVTATKAAGA